MFPPRIEAQLLKVEDLDVAIVKVSILILLFKSELLQATSSSMLAYMKDRTNNIVHTNEPINEPNANERTKENTPHEAFSKLEKIQKS